MAPSGTGRRLPVLARRILALVVGRVLVGNELAARSGARRGARAPLEPVAPVAAFPLAELRASPPRAPPMIDPARTAVRTHFSRCSCSLTSFACRLVELLIGAVSSVTRWCQRS